MLVDRYRALSPPRRVLVVGTALGLVLALLLLVVPRLGGGSAVTASAPQGELGPVLLVPGYGGSAASFDVLAARLRAAGRDAVVVRLPSDGTGDLREQARALSDAVDDALEGGAPSVDLVGYSAGGVVARLWAADLGGAALARRVVTLGSPHHGTSLAGIATQILPGACPTACQQLTPSAPLLRELNGDDETPDGPRWVSVWTAQDETVTPPSSGRLEGAVDVQLQAVCADAQVSHGALPRDPLVIGVVLSALGADPVAPPAASDCRSLRALGSAG